MGRDTTAHIRMAAKRSREKAAGLRRLNVALAPEVFEKLAELMKQLSCPSQAKLIEFLVKNGSGIASSQKVKKCHKDLVGKASKETRKPASRKKTPNKHPKKTKTKQREISIKQETPTAQLSLFD